MAALERDTVEQTRFGGASESISDGDVGRQALFDRFLKMELPRFRDFQCLLRLLRTVPNFLTPSMLSRINQYTRHLARQGPVISPRTSTTFSSSLLRPGIMTSSIEDRSKRMSVS